MKRHINYHFLLVSSLLIIFGWLFLATLSAPASLQAVGTTNYYLFHHLSAIGIGLVLSFIAFKTPLDFLKKASPFLLLTNLLLLILVFFPVIGTQFWGARRWINLWGNTLQPSEFLKVTSILYFSSWIAGRFSGGKRISVKFNIKEKYQTLLQVFVPFLCLLSVITLLLYLQRDISTLGIIGITLIIIYFSAGAPLWHLASTLLMGSIGIALFIFIEPYRLERLKVFLHPEVDPLGRGLQLKQSLIALGSGGFFGEGWGMSVQKFGFLPQAMTDSIFAILGEETGIIGCMALVLMLLLFFWFGFKIANSVNDTFSKLTAIGIVTWITFQSFINIASTIGIFPLSGIPLPFFSYGGSHIIAEMIGVGILLNISKNR